MGNARRIQAGFVLGIVFLAVAFLPFCHTERTIGESRTCPACHFFNVSAAVLILAVVLVIRPAFAGTIARVSVSLPFVAPLDGTDSRSPPLV